MFWSSPGQTITTFQPNISRRCWAQHVARVWPPCCDMLRHVGCCWLKFENGQIFHATFVDVVWGCSRLVRFVQQCCARACALVQFSIPNMAQHVPTGWPNTCNMFRPTMFRCVAFKCCDRLAGASHSTHALEIPVSWCLLWLQSTLWGTWSST